LIRREWNVVDIADAQEALDVGFVGVGAEGIDEEEDGADLAGGDAGGDLGVAAHRAGEQAFNFQAGGGGDALAGGACGDESERGKLGAVTLAEGDNFIFLFVVGNEGEGGHGRIMLLERAIGRTGHPQSSPSEDCPRRTRRGVAATKRNFETALLPPVG